jgi:hypothetical protein
MLAQYTKAVVTLVAAALAALAAQVGAGEVSEIDGNGWVKIAVVLLGGTALTAFVENITGVAGGIIKAVLAAATAFFTSLAAAYENDGLVSQGELLIAGSLAFAALAAVYQLKNVPPSGA